MVLKSLKLGEAEKTVDVQESERIRKKVKIDIRVEYLHSLRADHIADIKYILKNSHKNFAEENGYKVICSRMKFSCFEENVRPNYSSIAVLIENKEEILGEKELERIIKYNDNPLVLLNKLFEADLVIPG